MMNTNPITDAAALSKLQQTGSHEWTVAGEAYPDYSSAMNAARSILATEHAAECEQRADELEAELGSAHYFGPVNGERRSPAGLRIEAESYRGIAVSYAMKAPR